MPSYLLIDISNSFTKIAKATAQRLGNPIRVPTASLKVSSLQKLITPQTKVVLSSVVPAATKKIVSAFPDDTIHVGPRHAAGLRIHYPQPSRIGADRLANAVACVGLHGYPAIVVDFGTAVTFDVISKDGAYVGGVIAPGLGVMAEYLHTRTALLPLIQVKRPKNVVGKSTHEAMLSGAVHGYRGLVREILIRIREEQFPRSKPLVIATGGDSGVLNESLSLFDLTDPLLTLRGLQLIANHRWAPQGS
ncbi:MAG: type III pantothenate kinase [Terrimicrobiaceae bacterium]